MIRERLFTAAALCGLILALGCGQGDKAVSTESGISEWSLPYQRIPTGGEDPAEYGPDDSTVLAEMPGNMGEVGFSHFTHASNAMNGYRIPCRVCHHNVAEGEDPGERCADCHRPPHDGDPAHGGPDDNMLFIGKNQDPAKVLPVPFTHFSHASNQGHKIACETCHHTGDLMACSECHQADVSLVSEKGKFIPKMKRAAHLKCKGCHQAVNDRHPEAPAPITCKGCHTLEAPRRLAGPLSLDRAYHLDCIGCHQRVALAIPGAHAPGGDCGGCHRWEKPPKDDSAGTTMSMVALNDLGPSALEISFGQDRKPTTPLNHRHHQELIEHCETCHHEGLDIATCSDCHEAEDAKEIYHQLCIGCHEELGAPARCSACHPEH
ncbi:MAG: cytochrome c family protein [Candidatus Eisenbacteria bacterium]|uniref:Cytochrome c family protein n=1 Tax=Eiseniibacteriota bacterium TaxID=2212470 RepID=A0A948RZB9_UNCEI|nr:cytochrome c family protein [Candidatus Eisenbacteria bacterium]MBU1951261.1 cytochrome c family protein [Candidatus Eisenbacteria bacterium]MBU2691009.1 cytochrome c family protein [Candidatus Eisenbacteria bacterium]